VPVIEGGVPGFGAPAEELAMVAAFGNGNDIPTTPLEKRYDSRVLERVSEALSRYDRNKDGAIDSNEWREWRSSSDPRTFDKNGDGRLNREEIAARYASYSSGSSRSSGSSSSRSSDSDRRSEDRGRGDERRDGPSFFRSDDRRDGPSFGRSDSRSDGRPSFWGGSSRGGDSRGGDSSSGSSGDRMAMMAGMIMERLDQNRNGFVDGDELKSMRSDPKTVDKNSDGKISKDELSASIGSRSFGGPPGGGPPGGGPSFGGRSGDSSSGGRFFGGPSGGPSGRESFFGGRSGESGDRYSRSGDGRSWSRDADRSSRDGRSDSRRGSITEEKPKSYRLLTAAERLAKQYEELPDWFGRKDVNGDAQVSMSEFASVWSEIAAYEFARADRNGDGAVTASEAIAGPRELPQPSSSSGGYISGSYSAGGTEVALGSSDAGPTDSGDKYAKQAKTILGQLDGNKDRAVASDEWSAKSWTKTYGDFAALDANTDGKLDEAEITGALKARGK
jgi:Ca2+-binding EF-hand superfamily protein